MQLVYMTSNSIRGRRGMGKDKIETAEEQIMTAVAAGAPAGKFMIII